MQTVDIVLLDLQMHASETGPASAEAVHTTMAGPAFAPWLRSSAAHVEQIEELLVADAAGRVLVAAGRLSSASCQAAMAEAAARHFAAAPGDTLFIGAPLPEPASAPGQQPWIVHLARPVTLPDGTPAGVVVASLRLDSFGSLYAGLRLPADALVALLRRDGTLLLRQPPLAQLGMRVRPDSPWHAAVAHGGGRLRLRSSFDGRERMLAVQPLRDYPLSPWSGWRKPPPWRNGTAMPPWPASARSRRAAASCCWCAPCAGNSAGWSSRSNPCRRRTKTCRPSRMSWKRRWRPWTRA